ncbi:MAG: PQQ-dependent sugar dehydrogenase [Chthoniobacterales bacterium]
MKASSLFVGLIGATLFLTAETSFAKKFTVNVGTGGDFFSPAAVTVEPGDEVEWDWDSSFHSTTSGTPGNPSGMWNSDVHQTGYKFNFTFNTIGSFDYYCSVHGGCCSMVGTVNVVAGSPSPSPSPSPSLSPSPSPSPSPSQTPLPPRLFKGPVRLELQQVAGGFNAPNDLTSVGDGRLFVNQQGGLVRIVKNGILLATPFLDVSARLISTDGERGLLGLAFHPGYNDPSSPGFGKFYTYTSEPVAGLADFTVPKSSAFDHQSMVAEWQVSAGNPDVANPASRREVLRVDEPQANHNGGKLAFRPGEPYLYISLGDGGAGNDVGDGHNPAIGNGQDLTTVLGKILRIDPLDPSLTSGSADPVSTNGSYRVPANNPFIGSGTSVHEIYAYGLRNPFRFSFDAPTGRLIVGDVGQANIEEVDFVEAGKNYGWNRKEGSFLFNPGNGSITPDPNPDPALTDPVLEYSHEDGSAIIGGFVEHGTAVPALASQYVFGDYIAPNSGSGRLFYSDFAGGLTQELRIGEPERDLGILLKGFGQDDNGDVYALGDSGGNGIVYKLVSIPANPTIVNLSTRLNVGTNDNVLIGGFIVTGSDTEEVVLRGIGPSLPVGGSLPNPKLELHNSTGALIASNDNWMDGPNKDQILTLGLAPVNPAESALVAELAPGSYTAILSDADGATGNALVELYATNAAALANPVNISTRGFVQTGDDVMIGGFIVAGTETRTLLLRAIGPSLGTAGVSNPLLDPKLELHDENGALLSANDNWRDTQESEIAATGLQPTDNREAAILMDLTPSSYTAILQGANGTTGVALVEVYDVD